MQDSNIFKKKLQISFESLCKMCLYFHCLALPCWLYFIIFHWTISAGFWDKMIFLPRQCFLPIYIEAIFLSVIFPETVLAFLLRDRLNRREADQRQPERTISLNGLYLSLFFFFFLKLYIFNGGPLILLPPMCETSYHWKELQQLLCINQMFCGHQQSVFTKDSSPGLYL